MSQKFNDINLYICYDKSFGKNIISTYGTGNPDATLYINQGQSLFDRFTQSNLSPKVARANITINGQTYIAFIIEVDTLFKTFCENMINKKDGEYYDCQYPDKMLRPY